MLTQTIAIFVDAYRELNARKLFWATLILSGLVVAVFALIGINEKGLRVIAWDIDLPGFNTSVISQELFYKSMYVNFGIGFWLTWIAAILALISTASIFPDFVSGGSIDLALSQPIGRLRLFLTKYVAGLLFVMLQVSIFSLASFVLIGVMGGAWEAGIFLAIPIVTLFFSYLYCVCVLLGIVTRSTIAALMLTILFWFVIFLVDAGETTILTFKVMFERQREAQTFHLDKEQSQLGSLKSIEQPDQAKIDSQNAVLTNLQKEMESNSETQRRLETAHWVAYGIKTALPKTGETVGLLERWMIDLAELPKPESTQTEAPEDPFINNADGAEFQREIAEELRGRSVWWVIGTSVVFEVLVLSLASWIFIRRDF